MNILHTPTKEEVAAIVARAPARTVHVLPQDLEIERARKLATTTHEQLQESRREGILKYLGEQLMPVRVQRIIGHGGFSKRRTAEDVQALVEQGHVAKARQGAVFVYSVVRKT